MGYYVPIFLSVVNKFHNSIIDFDRPTSIIAFGGKIKIVNFFKQLDFYVVPLRSECKIHRHYYSTKTISSYFHFVTVHHSSSGSWCGVRSVLTLHQKWVLQFRVGKHNRLISSLEMAEIFFLWWQFTLFYEENLEKS